jgi:hypothetical protein
VEGAPGTGIKTDSASQEWTFTGDDVDINSYVAAGGNIIHGDKMVVEKVEIDGLVLRSETGLDDLSQFEELTVEMTVNLVYKWATRTVNPLTDPF